MSEQWYRNRDWDAEIAAAFEAKIARGRTQKAQHLMIQGQALIARHPAIAVELLQRSIALDDEYHVNQANCYLAMAYLALGQVDAALGAYVAALEAQLRLPNIQSSAPLDFAFIVAWFARADHYPAALPILAAVKPSPFPGADFQAHAAHALILADRRSRRRSARQGARRAGGRTRRGRDGGVGRDLDGGSSQSPDRDRRRSLTLGRARHTAKSMWRARTTG